MEGILNKIYKNGKIIIDGEEYKYINNKERYWLYSKYENSEIIFKLSPQNEVIYLSSPSQYKLIKEVLKMEIDLNKNVTKTESNVITLPSKEQRVLDKLRSDKYSEGAMIGAYMNKWVDSLDKFPSFNEWVKKNVELRIKLENMEM